MLYDVQLKKISKENFASFGGYFDESSSVPVSAERYFSWWNGVGIIDIKGRTSVGVVRPVFNPDFSETIFEQHRNTPEVLIPVDEDVILLLGKEAAFKNEIPSKEDFEAFLVPRGTVVSINPGVWHHSPMAMNKFSRVIVLFKENTSQNDNAVRNTRNVDLTVKVDTNLSHE